MSIFIEGHSRMLKEGFRRKWLELLFHRRAFAQGPVCTHMAGVRAPVNLSCLQTCRRRIVVSHTCDFWLSSEDRVCWEVSDCQKSLSKGCFEGMEGWWPWRAMPTLGDGALPGPSPGQAPAGRPWVAASPYAQASVINTKEGVCAGGWGLVTGNRNNSSKLQGLL